MGDCNHDDRGLRRHDSQDIPRHVRRVAVRAHRRADDSASGSGHRVQLRAVLFAHPGASQAAQEAPSSAAGRGRQTEGVSPPCDRQRAGCSGSKWRRCRRWRTSERHSTIFVHAATGSRHQTNRFVAVLYFIIIYQHLDLHSTSLYTIIPSTLVIHLFSIICFPLSTVF